MKGHQVRQQEPHGGREGAEHHQVVDHRLGVDPVDRGPAQRPQDVYGLGEVDLRNHGGARWNDEAGKKRQVIRKKNLDKDKKMHMFLKEKSKMCLTSETQEET